MYDGTLYGQWEALVTFQQMIVLCDADGMVDMTPPAIAARTSIPLEIITKGLSILESPDPYSRTPSQEGRRIELIDAHRPWGWHIVNHHKYQHMQDSDTIRAQTRERVRKHREQKALERNGNGSVTDGNAQKRHTDTDTDTDVNQNTLSKPAVSPCPHLEIISAYHRLLPAGRQINAKLWNGTRAKHLQARWREDSERQTLAWWENFFTYCGQSKFLTGRTPPRLDRNAFEISLDWIVNPTNFAKIHEGTYHR
jgi:hypothetical protein